MAASRRLQLAAEQHGVTALLLLRWGRKHDDPTQLASSASGARP
jgi:hypothetical protein